jgi:hypothetical protein
LHHGDAQPSFLKHEPIVPSIAYAHGHFRSKPLHIFELVPSLILPWQNRQLTGGTYQLIPRFAEGISRQNVDVQRACQDR